jgi:hypothetical protein
LITTDITIASSAHTVDGSRAAASYAYASRLVPTARSNQCAPQPPLRWLPAAPPAAATPPTAHHNRLLHTADGSRAAASYAYASRLVPTARPNQCAPQPPPRWLPAAPPAAATPPTAHRHHHHHNRPLHTADGRRAAASCAYERRPVPTARPKRCAHDSRHRVGFRLILPLLQRRR